MPLDSLLSTLDIVPETYQHPPLQDCKEADRLSLVRDGVRTKNLFLRDNYGKRHFLLVTRHDVSVDLNQLSRREKISRLGFASAERLKRYLALEPGHVSLLALINDPEQQVTLWIDKALWGDEPLQCHPLDNCQTWLLYPTDIEALLNHWQRSLVLLDIPVK